MDRFESRPLVGTDLGTPRSTALYGAILIVAAAGLFPFFEHMPRNSPTEEQVLGWIERMPSWERACWVTPLAVEGVVLLATAFAAASRASRKRRITAASPDQEWRADYAWDERGAWAHGRSAWSVLLHVLVFAVPWSVPWHSMAVREGEAVFLFAAVFDATLVLVVALVGAKAIVRWRCSDAFVRYKVCPFHPGAPVELSFCVPHALRRSAAIRFVLRCVEEIPGVKRAGARLLGAYEKTVTPPAIESEVPLRFELPADSPTNAIQGVPPRLWELEVSTGPGLLAYRGVFLVPVYPRT